MPYHSFQYFSGFVAGLATAFALYYGYYTIYPDIAQQNAVNNTYNVASAADRVASDAKTNAIKTVLPIKRYAQACQAIRAQLEHDGKYACSNEVIELVVQYVGYDTFTQQQYRELRAQKFTMPFSHVLEPITQLMADHGRWNSERKYFMNRPRLDVSNAAKFWNRLGDIPKTLERAFRFEALTRAIQAVWGEMVGDKRFYELYDKCLNEQLELQYVWVSFDVTHERAKYRHGVYTGQMTVMGQLSYPGPEQISNIWANVPVNYTITFKSAPNHTHLIGNFCFVIGNKYHGPVSCTVKNV